jgi:hypothetical protein
LQGVGLCEALFGLKELIAATEEALIGTSRTGRDPTLQVEGDRAIGRDPLTIVTSRDM